jgi:hypothetical protein
MVGNIVAVGVYSLLVSAILFAADRRDIVLWDDEWLSREVNLDGVPFDEACQHSFLRSSSWADIRFIYFSMTWATTNMPFSGGWIPAALLGGLSVRSSASKLDGAGSLGGSSSLGISERFTFTVGWH